MPCYLTPSELGFQLDATSSAFHRVYASLLHADSNFVPNLKSESQPLLLLLAILSDSIAIQRSLSGLCRLGSSCSKAHPNTRYAPSPYHVLSPSTEFRRMKDQLSSALDKWKEIFGRGTGGNELALFHFCRLYLSCDELSTLPQLANYAPTVQREGTYNAGGSVAIGDQAVAHAWAILENVDTNDQSTICPIWSPIVVFYGALAIWARTQQQEGQSTRFGSPKQVLAFKIELERMPWPCCGEMASTLDRLLQRQLAI